MTRHPNRYGSAFVEKTPEEDAADWETWLEMSEAEQDAVLAQVTREANERYDALSDIERYQFRRLSALRSCITSRLLLREHRLDMFREHLRDAQKRLLRLRMERYQGVSQIGEA